MKKTLLSSTVACLFFIVAQRTFAQHDHENENTSGVIRCATTEYMELQKQQDPELEDRMAKIEADMQAWMKNHPPTINSIITIPVVFHVVYNTAAQNVADKYLQQQMDVLNKDFSKKNTDWTQTPAAFQPLVANCEIQFCFASKTPTGSATNGIVRVQTTQTSFSTDNAVKYTAQGGDDIWDRDKYLNIWVCNIGGSVLGYAQLPGSAAATDGVVIRTSTVPGQTFKGDYDMGRTGTHEVGHWLNLRHVFEGGCSSTDNVADTPPQQSQNFGCPNFPHVTCNNGPNGDMFINYMDYSDDDCIFMFSNGQKDRMHAALNGPRASLLTSAATNCILPTFENGGSPVAVPSAFTPNGDGVNDSLYVLGASLIEMDFRIYNEWGNEIFSATDQNVKWGGTYKDKLLPGGRYAYLLRGTMADGVVIPDMKGTITLIR